MRFKAGLEGFASLPSKTCANTQRRPNRGALRGLLFALAAVAFFVLPVSAGMETPFSFPGGTNSDVQYNDNGVFGGSDTFHYDPTSGVLYVTSVTCSAGCGGGGSGTPAGNSGEVQFNLSGAFGSDADLFYSTITKVLTLDGTSGNISSNYLGTGLVGYTATVARFGSGFNTSSVAERFHFFVNDYTSFSTGQKTYGGIADVNNNRIVQFGTDGTAVGSLPYFETANQHVLGYENIQSSTTLVSVTLPDSAVLILASATAAGMTITLPTVDANDGFGNFISIRGDRYIRVCKADLSTGTVAFAGTIRPTAAALQYQTECQDFQAIYVSNSGSSKSFWIPTGRLTAPTGVTAASYTNINATVDAYGRITAASNGSAGSAGSTTIWAENDQVSVNTAVSTITFNGIIGSSTIANGRIAVFGRYENADFTLAGSSLAINKNIYATALSVSTGSLSVSSATATYLQNSSATATYLQNSSASVTYAGINVDLSKSSATATYLQNSSATATYLQNSSASVTYAGINIDLSKASATVTYLQNSSATATYLQNSSASVTYAGINVDLSKASATATYLQNSSATATYLQNSSASVTYAGINVDLSKASATATYLQNSSATATYLSKSSAAATYLPYVALDAGTGISLNPVGTHLSITSTAGGGASALAIDDEGVQKSSPTMTINFVGAGVTATLQGTSSATVTIPGGGGGGDNFGSHVATQQVNMAAFGITNIGSSSSSFSSGGGLVVNSSLTVNQGLYMLPTVVTSSYTMVSTNTVIVTSCTTGCEVTLPSPGLIGQVYTFIKSDSGSAIANIRAQGSDLIFGTTNLTYLFAQNANGQLIYDGTNKWLSIGHWPALPFTAGVYTDPNTATSVAASSGVVYVAVYVPEPCTAYGVRFVIAATGGTAAKIDLGIYDTDIATGAPKNKLASTGSTTVPAIGVDSVNFTSDVNLMPGNYWIAAQPSFTGTTLGRSGIDPMMGTVAQANTGATLPTTATGTSNANARNWAMVLLFRHATNQ